MMLTKYLATAVIAIPWCLAQLDTSEPCAQIAKAQAAGQRTFDAALAEACLRSVPINGNDALQMIDGLKPTLDFQSTVGWLKNPPSGYLLPAVDLIGELSKLRDQISSGTMRSEIDFERNLTSILARAHDGHLTYALDGMSVFTFATPFRSLDVVSLDGKQAPGIYLHDEIVAFVNSRGRSPPSAIVSINGVATADWIADRSQNGTVSGLQDPDALFNAFMFAPMSNAGRSLPGLFSGVDGEYRGASITLAFANGSTSTKPNFAFANADFTGVVDGPSFGQKFCNSTVKNRSKSKSAISTKTISHKVHSKRAGDPNAKIARLENYPTPTAISPDGSLSGYFLTSAGFEDTAVMVITNFPMEFDQTQKFQTTLTSFLDLCRSRNKKRLIIDLSNNPGGAVTLVYEVFKQLFPSIDAYAAGNFRFHEAVNVIGQSVTDNVQKAQQASGNNHTVYKNAGGESDFNARAYLSENGTKFNSWTDLAGPVKANGDSFTNLFRWDLSDTSFTMDSNGIVVSGFGGKPVAAQPFDSQNIVIVGDGQCSSSCTTLSHLLKWQGKIKSVAVGGRPQNGPMQSQGGVKGSQITDLIPMVVLINQTLTTEQQVALARTNVAPLVENFRTMVLRTANAGQSANDISFNWKNNIAEGDSTFTPLQFVYEAADCKLWNRAAWTVSPVSKWLTIAQQAFGVNGTAPWSGCVEGSTNHPSSLSGNAKLFNNGVPNNVTSFIQSGSDGSGTAKTNTGDDSKPTSAPKQKGNGSGRLTSSATLALVIAAAVAVCL